MEVQNLVAVFVNIVWFEEYMLYVSRFFFLQRPRKRLIGGEHLQHATGRIVQVIGRTSRDIYDVQGYMAIDINRRYLI